VLADGDEAAGLADADPRGDVLQDGHDLVPGQPGVEQRRALALGEARLAGAAVPQAAPLPAVAHAHRQVAVPAPAVVGARLVRAAEAAQVVVHDRPSVAQRPGFGVVRSGGRGYKTDRTRSILKGHDPRFGTDWMAG